MTWSKENALAGGWTLIPRIFTPGDEIDPELRYSESSPLTYADMTTTAYNIPEWPIEDDGSGDWNKESSAGGGWTPETPGGGSWV